MSLSASLASSSGRCSPARRASCASALCAGVEVDEVREPVQEAADDCDVAGAEVAVALRGGGRGQYRLQGLTVTARRSPRSAASWIRREASARLIRSRLANTGGQLAAQLGRSACSLSWLIKACSTVGLPAAQLFAALQYRQPLRGGQRIKGQVQGALVVGLERVEDLDDLFPTTRTHVRIITTRPEVSSAKLQ